MKEKKYIIITILFLVGLTCSVRAFDIPIENPGFELPGVDKIKGWDMEDGAYYVGDGSPAEVPGWESDGTIIDSGVESAYLSPTSELWRGFLYNQDPSVYNFTEATIVANRTYTMHFDTTGLLKASFIYGTSSDRHEIFSATFAPTEWESFSFSFASDDYPDAIGQTLGIEFMNASDTATYTWHGIDNVRLESFYVNCILPEDGSVAQPIDSDLEWTVDNVWSCNVYFGTDPNIRANPQVITDQVADTYDPGILGYATTYYWAVDAIDPNDGSPYPDPGPTWTFKTISDVPEVIQQPESVAAFVGETVQMSVVVASAYPDYTYQWYRDDTALTDDAKHSGTDTDMLTIYDLVAEDNTAEYYCRITNSEGSTDSDIAMILIKRLLAHYKFEGDVTDELGENDGSVEGGKLDYVPGIDDGLAAEASNKNMYIELSTEAYPKAGVGNGLLEGTVSCWVKIGYIGTEYRIFGDVNSGAGTAVLLKAPVAENDFVGVAGFWIRDDNNVGAEVHSAVGVCDGQWHHLAVTWDCEGGFVRIYVDGVQDGEVLIQGMGTFSDWEYPMTILAGMDAGSVIYNYSEPLDELQFYNYAMTKTEIAAIYYEQTGVELCAVEYPEQYDLSGPEGVPDCSFDMYDILEMFEAWLECGMYPECP